MTHLTSPQITGELSKVLVFGRHVLAFITEPACSSESPAPSGATSPADTSAAGVTSSTAVTTDTARGAPTASSASDPAADVEGNDAFARIQDIAWAGLGRLKESPKPRTAVERAVKELADTLDAATSALRASEERVGSVAKNIVDMIKDVDAGNWPADVCLKHIRKAANDLAPNAGGGA